MRVPLKELMEKLGVGYELSPYETCPWMCYDEDKQITCSAEVRMGPAGCDIEAEVQFMMDEDAPYEEEDESEEGGRTGSVASGLALGPGEEPEEDEAEKSKEPEFPPLKPGTHQQIFYMRILPSTDQWKPEKLVIKGKNYVNLIGGWDEKGCELFASCVQSIQMGELPDIEELITSKMVDESASGRRGRIGRKSPKVKPAALMGMKQGGM
jgi:hypothetical protein